MNTRRVTDDLLPVDLGKKGVYSSYTRAYNLMFQPGGAPQVGPGARNSLFDASFYNVAIRAGEVHRYQFKGKFADIFDGSIRRDSPQAFKVARKK